MKDKGRKDTKMMMVKLEEDASDNNLLPYFDGEDLVLALCETDNSPPWPALIKKYEGRTAKD